MINQETPFKFIANCIPVKGANRSVICDLHRKDIKLIPNDLFDLIKKHEGKRIEDIKKYYLNKYDDVIDEYFRFLIQNEFIFFTEVVELFPKMSLKWDDPNEITNAIIDLNEGSKYSFYKVIEDLNNIGCKHIEIRFFKSTNFDELQKIVEFLNQLESSIISVDFTLPYQKDFNEKKIKAFITEFPRIFSFKIYGSSENIFLDLFDEQKGYVIYSEKLMGNMTSCGVIDASLFSINIKSFTESLNHNSCLNRKISIDADGNIKNCPSMQKNFGNIKDTTLQEALGHKGFKKYWNTTKDQIEVCKDCEFRYVCTDCRAYIENPEDDYSKPLKCGYSPYTNKWEEWSTNPLKQKAIEYYGMKDLKKND